MRSFVTRTAAAFAVAAAWLAAGPESEARRFGYVYEPKVAEKGEVELEQWVTLRAGKENGEFTAWDFREEIEYGLADRLQTALYLNFAHERSDGVAGFEDESEWEFEGVSSEWIYLLKDMKEAPVGVALYLEGTVGEDEYELEEKLLIGKRYDRWSYAVNLTLEQEWEEEDGETEEEGALEVSAGASWKLGDKWFVGLEGRNDRAYPDYDEEEFSAWFLGPSVHYHGDEWEMTLSVLPQIYGDGEGSESGLQLSERERIEVRLIAGVEF